MKRPIKLVLFAALLLIGSSCQKTEPQSNAENCLLPSFKEELKLYDSQGALILNSGFTTHSEEESEALYSIATIARKDYDRILESLGLELDANKSSALFLIIKKDGQNLNLNSLHSLLFYTFMDSSFHAQAFQLNEGKFNKDERIDFKTTKIRSNIANFLRDEAQANINEGTYRIIEIFAEDINNNKPSKDVIDQFPTTWLSLKLSQVKNRKTNDIIGGGSLDRCPLPCGGPVGTICNEWNDEPGAMYCEDEEGTICSSTKVKNALDDSNFTISNDSIELAFDDSKHYAFRDNFLMNYSSGRAYIQNYYYVGGILQAVSIPTHTLVNTLYTLITINRIIDMLQNPNIYGAKIPISSSDASQICKLIDEYLLLSSDRQYQSILMGIKADVNAFKGKSVNTILAQIK